MSSASKDAVGEGRGSNEVNRGTQTDLRICGLGEQGDQPTPSQTINVGTQTDESFLRRVTQDDQLLPGFPNEVTLDLIVPKLPWRAFLVLSSVSRAWREAIHSRQVHDARVRSGTTETFLVTHLDIHFGEFTYKECLGVYSLTDKCSYRLPDIPQVKRGIPSQCQFIALDGKVYVLGGMNDGASHRRSVREVYVFDLAGRKEWIQCASMEEPRRDFGCGVMDGLIYALGGRRCGNSPVLESEVYDPQENSWEMISPMELLRCHHRVATVGNELVVYGGLYFDPDLLTGSLSEREIPAIIHSAETALELYDSVMNEWILIDDNFPPEWEGELFVVENQFYLMNNHSIYLLDVHDEERVWHWLHSYSFVALGSSDPGVEVRTLSTLPFKDELLLVVIVLDNTQSRFCLLESKGFGSDVTDIVWQIEALGVEFSEESPLIGLIEL